jgi:hypothetical protein
MNASLRKLAPAAVGALLSITFTGAVVAADAKTGCRTSDPMRNSVMRKADEGTDALRRYVMITRAIHQLDMDTVAASIDRWRAESGCVARAAGAEAALPTIALKSGD